ncbi:MAG TPA: hypothetical protein VH677_01850 [Nitrososphaera sp.]
MKLEGWISLASLGLSVMYVALILSFYNFLISQSIDPTRIIDPAGLLIQQVSISAAPSIILAGVAFAMTRSTGHRQAGLLLVGAGAVMTAGMFAAMGMVPQIRPQYVAGGIAIVPYIFAAAGIAVLAMGGYLAAVSKKSRQIDPDDLR